MKCSKLIGGLFAISSILASSSFAATITFEELGDISAGSVSIGIIGDIDFGTLRAFDTASPDMVYLSASPRNAALFSARITYEISASDGSDFDFLGGSFVRSYAEGDFFSLVGKNDGVTLYSRYLEAVSIVRNETPKFFDFDWKGIDSLSIVWTGIGQHCCSTGYAVMDNFTYQPSNTVPEPGMLLLSCVGMGAMAIPAFRRGIPKTKQPLTEVIRVRPSEDASYRPNAQETAETCYAKMVVAAIAVPFHCQTGTTQGTSRSLCQKKRPHQSTEDNLPNSAFNSAHVAPATLANPQGRRSLSLSEPF